MPILCLDPTVTPPVDPYSTDYGAQLDWNDLFGTFLGVQGTVGYSKFCFPPNGITINVAGRVGFMYGKLGSVQDTAYGGDPIDDWLGLTMGMYDGVGGNWGYAKSVRQEGTAAPTRTLFGQNAIDTTYYGASDRYFVGESTNDNIRISLRVDIKGDTSRLTWTMTNTGPQANIGLEFGQWVEMLAPSLGDFIGTTFVEVPGFRPLHTDHRFRRDPNLNATSPHENPMPPYANFGMTQSLAYGLKVPTMADPSIPDQTPVDILDIGKAGFLLGIETGNSTPMPAAYSTPSPILEDTSIFPDVGYVQRWLPQLTNQNEQRIITAYYRSTWGVSDYAKPYAVTVDTPKVVAVNDNDPQVFNPNPMVIRVYVDNVNGFANEAKPIPLNDVRITLNLPQGMTDVDNPTSNRIVKFIDTVNPPPPRDLNNLPKEIAHHTLGFVDFQVNVDPTLYGKQSYTVTVEPQPGPKKTITGTIDVASQPRLLIRDAANLVTAPWQFTDTTWSTILGTGPNPLQINRDYQAFEWDANQQAYVLQTGPKRGFGNWLISTQDVGFKQLGGNPRTPSDLGSANGAPLIVLHSGWNLIANPYNYSIPVSQLVGVTATDPTDAHTFADLAGQNVIGSTLSFWDPNTQSYKFTQDFTDLLIPNRGYWLFVNTPQDVTISFGPVFTAFIPVGTGGITGAMKVHGAATIAAPTAKWKVNLAVRSGKVLDDQNYIGVVTNPADTVRARIQKPPVAPTPTAVSAAIVTLNGTKSLLLAQSLVPDASHNQWAWQVYTKSAGSTTISWPNANQAPASIQLMLTDLTTNQTIDMRKQSSYTFTSKAQSNRQFKITADSTQAVGPVLSSLTATRTGSGTTAGFNIQYQLGADATTSVRILQSGREVYVVGSRAAQTAGTHSVLWNGRDAANRRVKPGLYTIEVSATAPGRTTEIKTTSVFVLS
ncbi:hypothetical protein OP10G_1260 [Fimbriimonas ginsengisoli Gsoil 348]|uniref:FlgD/Vpr Ig-like domain-containing protein n=1 Tax=Fimbriimonas ginsengisoli Gsoil 348 TaxID=661478 RepID=A0A068NM47_FIMGI|nr:hypothetical protein OP10G_1260 [Fimbriimonas ginsengisoli Gsoil 348]